MLLTLKDLENYEITATDGSIGHVKDFYFDDKTWVVRYLVVDTGSWLPGRLVLLSPHAFGHWDTEEKILHVKLTRKQIELSPPIESHRPVSRQYETDYYRYYGWPAYWDGGALWGLGGYPVVLPPSQGEVAALQTHHHRDDKHLRSTAAVTGYALEAADGMIGHVSGWMVNVKSWAIGDLVVETGHWYAGKEILVSPHAVERISYEDSKVFVSLSQADIRRTAENQVARAGT